jgi:transcriptional regulator with XRE-family HTH domain
MGFPVRDSCGHGDQVDERVSPTFKRARLARILRSYRLQARLTLEEAAAPLFTSNRALSRIELGQQGIDPHFLKSMLDLYGVPADRWPDLVDLCLEARKKGWWTDFGLPQAKGAYTSLETEASEILEFALGLVPGLLQCPAYARAILLKYGRPPAAVDRGVEFRLARQERLTADEPLPLHAVIDQMSLTRAVGGERVRRAQCGYLAGLAELPNVSIQVLPLEAGEHVGMEGSFTVLRFRPRTDFPDVVYHQFAGSEIFIDSRERTGRICRQFADLSRAALGERESVALLERMAQ